MLKGVCCCCSWMFFLCVCVWGGGGGCGWWWWWCVCLCVCVHVHTHTHVCVFSSVVINLLSTITAIHLKHFYMGTSYFELLCVSFLFVLHFIFMVCFKASFLLQDNKVLSYKHNIINFLSPFSKTNKSYSWIQSLGVIHSTSIVFDTACNAHANHEI